MVLTTFKAELIERKNLTDETIKFTFTAPEDFTFQPGQFITFKMEKEGETKFRSYSILSSPRQKGKLDLCIKIINGGFASGIFSELEVGAILEAKGPFGHFLLNENGNEHVFLCVGAGIVPCYCILQEYLAKFPGKFFILISSFKKKKDLLFYDELKELEKKYSNFIFRPSLTREEWDGLTGRVQKHLPDDLKDKTFYICGLKELVLETKELLINKGVNPREIKFERYS